MRFPYEIVFSLFNVRAGRGENALPAASLGSIVAKARPGIRFNEHIEGDGPTVFAHACKMGRMLLAKAIGWAAACRRRLRAWQGSRVTNG